MSIAAGAWAASGPTGNARAIAIARASAQAYAQIPAATYTETGFFELTDQQGSSSYFDFNWGQSSLARGWSWATEDGILALHNDRVVWWRDELTPPPCTAAGPCHRIPIELVVDRSGAYWAFGSPANHTCFGRLRGRLPIVIGGVFQEVFGHFAAPELGPGKVRLTYTYPWGKGKRAKETDTLSTRTQLVDSSITTITGGHSFRASMNYPATTPGEPKVNLCTG